MAPASATARSSSAWANEELLQLVQAWEEVVDDPKNRLLLSTGERSTLHARFCAITGSNKRSLSSVTRQHHRLCTSYRLIVETNKRSLKNGSPGWFDLSTAEQHELRRIQNKKEKGMTVINPDLFRRLDRICGDKAVEVKKPKLKMTGRKQSELLKFSHHTKKFADMEEESLKNTWTARDWALFVEAWQYAVDEFLEYGNKVDEKVKLPNWLIRQKFVAVGGPQDTSVGSITAKKRCIIQSYHFIQQCVAGLEALDGSDWFQLTFNERYRLQRKLVSPKSSQRVGCEIDRVTFLKVGTIIDKEKELGMVTVTGLKRKRSKKKMRKPLMSSEASSEVSMSRSPSPSSSPDADEVSEPESETRDPVNHSLVDEDEEVHVDEKVVEALLEAQNARFEQLMHDLRDERMEERKQNQAMLLEILHQRGSAEDPNQNVSDMESLVCKQQQQLMDLFTQMHTERQQEREDFYALVRQLCSQARS
ncbi:unnamed protein product [Peronospora belbahrii]|uniref:Myb-like domain-containing protein n=1 Tax=Peronospora belbahrii TaxID=622444 RepID=A0AAU9L0E1_9STRA|nr:unnamed protein product [Peronospora belbahrii]CAH0514276.1 unnamed protein product [Peronospora belbahrii]